MNTAADRPRVDEDERRRRRRSAVNELLRHVERRGDPTIDHRAVPALGEVFDGDADVLRDLGGRWSRALAGHVDAVLDDHDDLTDVVEDAAVRLAAARPALHALLVAYADHPVVRRAAQRDAALVGVPHARAHAQHVRPRLRPAAERTALGGGPAGPRSARAWCRRRNG